MNDVTKPDPARFHLGKERIRRGGLAKEVFTGYDGSYCILGSIGYDACTGSILRPELELLGELLGFDPDAPHDHDEGCGCGGSDALFDTITQWNDVPERTPGEVIALLEQAEQKAEANW